MDTYRRSSLREAANYTLHGGYPVQVSSLRMGSTWSCPAGVAQDTKQGRDGPPVHGKVGYTESVVHRLSMKKQEQKLKIHG